MAQMHGIRSCYETGMFFFRFVYLFIFIGAVPIHETPTPLFSPFPLLISQSVTMATFAQNAIEPWTHAAQRTNGVPNSAPCLQISDTACPTSSGSIAPGDGVSRGHGVI